MFLVFLLAVRCRKILPRGEKSYNMSLILSPKLLTNCRPTSLDHSLILSDISPTAFKSPIFWGGGRGAEMFYDRKK